MISPTVSAVWTWWFSLVACYGIDTISIQSCLWSGTIILVHTYLIHWLICRPSTWLLCRKSCWRPCRVRALNISIAVFSFYRHDESSELCNWNVILWTYMKLTWALFTLSTSTSLTACRCIYRTWATIKGLQKIIWITHCCRFSVNFLVDNTANDVTSSTWSIINIKAF